MSAHVVRADSRTLPLADNTVDLVVTSPPYFGLRSYQDGGKHYDGQVGDEATPAEFVDALLAVTAECVRVLKPTGSLWVNLGDKYARPGGGSDVSPRSLAGAGRGTTARRATPLAGWDGPREKSLIGLPWRYALRCIDDLGLILRAEVIWSKPNGLPESVTDRVRRSHEQWFHFTREPRYFSAVDEVREEHKPGQSPAALSFARPGRDAPPGQSMPTHREGRAAQGLNPLGSFPGSVWTIPTQPLQVPAHLGVDHFAAFPMEWPRRIIRGWSPSGICVECGEGRRPTVEKTGSERQGGYRADNNPLMRRPDERRTTIAASTLGMVSTFAVTGESCACPEPTAPTRPAVVLDPFGGTGTTALVASALGRVGISCDLSHDYSRLARWRTTDPGQRAAAMQVEKPRTELPGQEDLFGGAA